MSTRSIEGAGISPPVGHYVPGIAHGGLIFVSGQVAKSVPPPPSAGAQTREALAQVAGILEAAGSGLRHLLQLTIFVSGIEHWREVDEAVRAVLGEHRPTRAVVPVGDFGQGRLVEIQAIAAQPEAGARP